MILYFLCHLDFLGLLGSFLSASSWDWRVFSLVQNFLQGGMPSVKSCKRLPKSCFSNGGAAHKAPWKLLFFDMSSKNQFHGHNFQPIWMKLQTYAPNSNPFGVFESKFLQIFPFKVRYDASKWKRLLKSCFSNGEPPTKCMENFRFCPLLMKCLSWPQFSTDLDKTQNLSS